MEITSITVILDESADTVLVTTNLPGAVWPFKDTLVLKFNAAKDTGAEYVRKHFGIEPTIKNAR